MPDSGEHQELVRHAVGDPGEGILAEDSRPIVLAALTHLAGAYVAAAVYMGCQIRFRQDRGQWILEFRNPGVP